MSKILDRMREDVQTVFAKDPAARTVWEVLCCYPGLHALWLYRLSHFLWQHRLLLLAVCRREGFPPNTIDGTIAAI